MVCFAHRAKEILTTKKRVCLYTSLTLLTLAIIGAAISVPLFLNEAWDCETTFYGLYGQSYRERRVLQHLVDGVLFFFIPFVVSVALYYRVIKGFKNMMTNQDRKQSLTKAFIISNVAWIFLWLPEFLVGVVFTFTDPGNADFIFAFLVNTSLTANLMKLYSCVNPIILIFVCRPFQQPLKDLLQKLKKNNETTALDETHSRAKAL